jgi:hypothetical protein
VQIEVTAYIHMSYYQHRLYIQIKYSIFLLKNMKYHRKICNGTFLFDTAGTTRLFRSKKTNGENDHFKIRENESIVLAEMLSNISRMDDLFDSW